MTKELSRSLSEVYEVIQNSEEEVVVKISKKFIDFIKENKDDTYEPNIDFSNDNWKNSLSKDAKTVISLIYRDFIATEEERREILEAEAKELAEIEKDKREKYNPDNIFRDTFSDDNNLNKINVNEGKIDNNTIDEGTETTKALTQIKQISWYKSIINKILELFGRK